ncbi:MAG: UDP-N-acetylmuramate--L-alanine ligase [Ruminococcaceae bacterium]|nr:UDP-N-acetylmuramate--L-alanine ligase [Oscillospiraceae bacterium]
MLNCKKITEYCENTIRKIQGKVFFAGIGGISMSAIAEYLLDRGVDVCGYDANRSYICDRLSSKGIDISYTFKEEMYEGVELAVFTNAIHESDPVYAYPKSKGIKCMTRAQMLGVISLEKKNRVGIAGTHGKSSTTGMLSSISLAANRDPSIFVGAELSMINGTHRDGKGEDFIFEACEYMDSFLDFFPSVSVVLNTQLDHVDYFGNLENVIKSFAKYINIPGEAGYALINGDCENSIKASENAVSKVVTFSVKDKNADFFADNIREEKGFYSFNIYAFGKLYTDVSLSVPGEVYVADALAAAGSAYLMGIDGKDVKEGLNDYTGVKRRFELRGKCNNAVTVDDYAHHPDEIRTTLKTARKMGFDNVICVFQPHTYTRTKALFDDFTDAFKLCDRLMLADIYSAREEPIEGVTSEALAEKCENGEYYPSFEKIAEVLRNDEHSSDTLIIVMGAGSIVKLTDMILTEKHSSFSELNIGRGIK